MDLSHQFEHSQPTFIQLGFNESALPSLKNYLDQLWQTNEDLNLISRQMNPAELIENHLIDCLLPLSQFPKNIKSVADFGTGGGLPGIIYALQFPHIQFHLFEKSAKKQIFLNSLKNIASNIHIHGEITDDKLKSIDLVIARGFKPIDVILDMSRNYYQRSGKYFLLKARLEKIEEEKTLALKKFKNLNLSIHALKSPVLDVERHLVLINS